MPGFFVLAGFFSALMLGKYSPQQFLFRRSVRLGVPLVVFGIILDQIVNCGSIDTWKDFGVALSRAYWIDTSWLQHLWFLSVLIQYTLLLFCIVKLNSRILPRLSELRIRLPILYALTCAGCFIATRISIIPIPSLVFVRPTDTFDYLTYFLVGVVFFFNKSVLERLIDKPVVNLVVVFLFLLDLKFAAQFHHASFLAIVKPAYILSLCGLVFWIARRYFNSQTDVIRRLCDASYTMYLVHWPLMIVLYRAVESWHIPYLAAVPVLIILTFGGSYLVHAFLVEKLWIGAALLNGNFSQGKLQKVQLPAGG
jgi:glucan biosynthesis protein C